MRIIVNGQPFEVEENSTAADLINLLNLPGKRLALEINLEIVPRSSFATHRLKAEDRVEIIHAIGGG